jgi:hypothetical protein
LKVISVFAFFLGAVTTVVFLLELISPVLLPSKFEKAALDQLTSYGGPIIAVCGVVIAWAYRSASARLGVVDLFACEISTLCRVGTIFDLSNQFIKRYWDEPSQPKADHQDVCKQKSSFDSEEEYFPVFDNNARDLQLLEATVVSSITEFYTYMKAMRDCLRKLSNLPESDATVQRQDSSAEEDNPSAWQVATRDTLYMLYLAYESGRKAVDDLIEFEPYSSERKIVILITELPAYDFLLQRFDRGDSHYDRLDLRREDYLTDVPTLYWRVMDDSHDLHDWQPARRSAKKMALRYEAALGESMEDARRRLGWN